MNMFMMIGIFTVILFSVLLKISNFIYNKKTIEKELQKQVGLTDISLLDSSVSHEKFEKVSRESSVLNSPARKHGDFFDFIIESISFTDVGIENRILTLNYGEEYDGSKF